MVPVAAVPVVSATSPPPSSHGSGIGSAIKSVLGFRTSSSRHGSAEAVPQLRDIKQTRSPLGKDRQPKKNAVPESQLSLGAASDVWSSASAAARTRARSPGPSQRLATSEIVNKLRQDVHHEGSQVQKDEIARVRAGLLHELASRVEASQDEELAPSGTFSSTEKGKSKDDAGLDTDVPPFSDLLEMACAECSPYSAPIIREAGFCLLAATLALPDMAGLSMVKTNDLFDLCLAHASATAAGAIGSDVETLYRIACLQILTKDGQELGLGLHSAMVTTLYSWLKLAGQASSQWCSSPSPLADDTVNEESTSNANTLRASHRGRVARLSWDAFELKSGLGLSTEKAHADPVDTRGTGGKTERQPVRATRSASFTSAEVPVPVIFLYSLGRRSAASHRTSRKPHRRGHCRSRYGSRHCNPTAFNHQAQHLLLFRSRCLAHLDASRRNLVRQHCCNAERLGLVQPRSASTGCNSTFQIRLGQSEFLAGLSDHAGQEQIDLHQSQAVTCPRLAHLCDDSST